MSKPVLIIAAIIVVILGILTLIPATSIPSMWLGIILLVVGVVSFILGLLDKRKA